MPHIELPEGMPGISGPLAAYPETAAPLRALAEALLRGPSPLTPAERETIAAYVSSRNGCAFCHQSHAAAARHCPGGEGADAVVSGGEESPASPKLKALLAIAEKVRLGGREVAPEDIARAREAGADDHAIHDAVLIAAAFCMFNRYVDGLGTWSPDDPAMYDAMGARLASEGYVPAPPSEDA